MTGPITIRRAPAALAFILLCGEAARAPGEGMHLVYSRQAWGLLCTPRLVAALPLMNVQSTHPHLLKASLLTEAPRQAAVLVPACKRGGPSLR